MIDGAPDLRGTPSWRRAAAPARRGWASYLNRAFTSPQLLSSAGTGPE